MELIAVCPPEYTAEAASRGFSVAHACYTIDKNGLCILKGAEPRGGIMLISGEGELALDEKLRSQIADECAVRRFSGVFFDMPIRTYTAVESLATGGLSLYLPNAFHEGAVAVVSSAISGGSFEAHLRHAFKLRPASGLALGLELTRMDFTLPEKSGRGRELSRDELKSLFDKNRGRSFFSEELCAFYFRYAAGGKNHMVLFDNERSVSRKLAIAEKLGFEKAFFYYPELRSMGSVINYRDARPRE